MSVSPIAIHEPTPITTCDDFVCLQQFILKIGMEYEILFLYLGCLHKCIHIN